VKGQDSFGFDRAGASLAGTKSEEENMNGTPTLLILADDLTGANDVGAQFAKRGIRSVVLVEPEVSGFPNGYEVVVVNTESRHAGARAAAERVRRIAELGLRAGAQYFFKKTDSTLRGNIGAELKALMEALGEETIPFVPAFPETGRTTRGGIHFVHGIPIAETEFARDPLSPVTASRVAEVLRTGCDLPVTSMSLQEMRGELPAGCVVLDAESREEMTAIARELARKGRVRMLAGSAGFAEELPQVLSLRTSLLPELNPRGPILLVNGSLNPRSLEQISVVDEGFTRIRLRAEVLMDIVNDEGLFERFHLASGGNVLLYSAESYGDAADLVRLAAGLGYHGTEAHLRVAARTGCVVEKAIRQFGFGTVIVFGGDTLLGIARACGWSAFVPRTEVGPGITVSMPEGTELTVVNKAGGFGEKDVVQSIVNWSQEHSKPDAEL
jgi:D-threonate/D-erythronate kinase